MRQITKIMLVERLKSLHRTLLNTFRLGPSQNKVIAILFILFLTIFCLHTNTRDNFSASNDESEFEVNNYGDNVNLLVNKTRYRDVPKERWKNILFWNDAYGTRRYDIGFGNEPFYEYRCPETRCYATANRSYLKSVADFDAVVIHQRGIERNDMPKKRSPKQW